MPADKGAQLIVDEILKEAGEKSARIIEAARREAKTILDAARFTAREEGEREVEEAKAVGKQTYEAMLAEGRMRAKKEVLRRREELVNEVFRGAKGRLVEYTSSEKYERDLIRIAIGACKKLGSDNSVIYANKRDLKLLKKNEGELARVVAADRPVSISFGEPIQTIGGVRVGTPDRKMEVDDTLEARMEREFEALRVRVAKILFEGST
ncbi:MAG: V-type ATP synthase subunit E family protein [Candidatus Hodarchaeaceae archaeon]|nr:V-type ATP synthase subunit E family protein [Candidatus Hodarchaeaceae archaeon]